MRGDAKVIEFLNAVLKGELTAVNQYWLHYRLLDNLGIKKLAAYERHESIDEMKHADQLMERIFFLDGLPGMQQLNRLRIGETVPEILQADLDLEHEAVALLRDAVQHCESVRPEHPQRRGRAYRFHRDPADDDRADGAGQLYPAAIRSRRFLIPARGAKERGAGPAWTSAPFPCVSGDQRRAELA